MLAADGDAEQLGPHSVAHRNRVTGGAYFPEQGLARLLAELEAGIAGLASHRRVLLVAPFRIHGADVHDEAIHVAECRVPLPLVGRLVAEHDLLAMFGKAGASVAERPADRPHVFGLSGEKQPARTSVKRVGKRL